MPLQFAFWAQLPANRDGRARLGRVDPDAKSPPTEEVRRALLLIRLIQPGRRLAGIAVVITIRRPTGV